MAHINSTDSPQEKLIRIKIVIWAPSDAIQWSSLDKDGKLNLLLKRHVDEKSSQIPMSDTFQSLEQILSKKIWAKSFKDFRLSFPSCFLVLLSYPDSIFCSGADVMYKF